MIFQKRILVSEAPGPCLFTKVLATVLLTEETDFRFPPANSIDFPMAISRIAATLGIASTLVTLATGTVVNSPAARAASSSLQFSPSSPQTRTTTTTTTHNNNNKRVTCEDVHIILARGWKEDYPGRQGVLVDAICAGQDSSACGYEDVIFDDSENSVYGPAVYQGAVAGISQVTDYATDCPNAKIVISGYSEGAHVFGDVLAGGGGDWFGTQEGSVTGLGSDATSPGSQSKLDADPFCFFVFFLSLFPNLHLRTLAVDIFFRSVSD